MQKSTMTRPYQIAAVVLILFSAFIARESIELKYYTALGPGPGFFPLWLSVIMIVLASFMLFHATFHPPIPMPDDFWASRIGYMRAGAVIVASIWAIVMMEKIGFRITMAVFFMWLFLTLGKANMLIRIAVTLICSLGGYWMFNDKLQVILPVGPWDDVFTNIGMMIFK